MTIDALASERHFADHLAPIWDALPAGARGRFVVPDSLQAHAAGLGIKTASALPIPQRPTLVASYGDLQKARLANRTRLILAEHGSGQSFSNDQPSYAGGSDRADVGLFLVPNTHAALRNQRRYPNATVEIVGCPKIDTLPAREPHPDDDGRPVVAISFHWNCSASLETRSAWRAYRHTLRDLVRRYRVIGHGHPRMLEAIRSSYDRLGIEVVPGFADICRRADLYVCDGVSTLYEFASTGRPVVVLNAPWYRKRVQHGLRFWDAADVGVQVDRGKDLIDGVELALRDAPLQRRRREAALDLVYAHRTGAAARAADAIVRWAASAPRAARAAA